MVNYFIWLLAGAVIGGLVTLIMHRRQPVLLLNIVVGSVSAFVVGYLLLPMLHINTTSFSLPGLLVSLGGSIVLLLAVNFFIREHSVPNILMEGHWDMVQRKIHSRWSKITEVETGQLNGNHEQLVNIIKERYGIAKEQAEDQLQKFLRALIY